MSILTYINKVPLYTTIDEAIEWAKYNNIPQVNGLNYHSHKHMSVTGYMGGNKHVSMPRHAVELPIKTKGKPGYKPKIGSRVISIIAGESTSVKVTTNTVYDTKGFPITKDEEDFEVLPQPVSGLAQLQSGLNPLNATTPGVVNALVVNAPVVTSTPVGGGGGGY